MFLIPVTCPLLAARRLQPLVEKRAWKRDSFAVATTDCAQWPNAWNVNNGIRKSSGPPGCSLCVPSRSSPSVPSRDRLRQRKYLSRAPSPSAPFDGRVSSFSGPRRRRHMLGRLVCSVHPSAPASRRALCAQPFFLSSAPRRQTLAAGFAFFDVDIFPFSRFWSSVDGFLDRASADAEGVIVSRTLCVELRGRHSFQGPFGLDTECRGPSLLGSSCIPGNSSPNPRPVCAFVDFECVRARLTLHVRLAEPHAVKCHENIPFP